MKLFSVEISLKYEDNIPFRAKYMTEILAEDVESAVKMGLKLTEEFCRHENYDVIINADEEIVIALLNGKVVKTFYNFAIVDIRNV